MKKKKIDVEGLYDNGLRFTAGPLYSEDGVVLHRDRLAYNLDKLQLRRSRKKPTVITVDGMSGEGKTTMCTHMADYLQGREISFEKQLHMGGAEFIKGMRVAYAEKLVVAIYTEAGDFGKKATLSRMNRTLDRVFETFRTFNVIVIVDLPFMPKLDNGLFEKGLVRMHVHVYGRRSKYGRFKVFDKSRALWLRYRAGEKSLVDKQKIYSRVQSNFDGVFKDLPPERSRELDRYCIRGKNSIIEEAEIEHSGLLSYEQLAARLDRTREWIVRKVRSAGFKPVKVYQNKNFYEEDVARSLAAMKKRRGGKR